MAKREIPTGTFNLNRSTVCINAGETAVYCEGTVTSGTLVAVFAKIVSQNSPDLHASPWDDSATNPPTKGVHGANWSVQNVPVQGGPDCRLIVWGIFDGENAFDEPSGNRMPFQVGSGGSGSGSGLPLCSGSGSSFSDLGCYDAAYHKPVSSVDAIPRVYALSLCIRSMHLDTFGAGYLAEGLLCSSKLYLTYDERLSTPTEMVWSAQNLRDAAGLWTLRITAGEFCSSARLDFREIHDRSVSNRAVWSAYNWQFNAANLMASEAEARGVLAFPDITIEPA